MNIMLVGSGGREHALAWKLAQSPLCDRLFCGAGNLGTADHGENLAIPVSDLAGLIRAAKDNHVEMVVVGPERPLEAGLVDQVRAAGMLCFGPTAEAARLECDKVFAKELMRGAQIPTAEARAFREFKPARDYVLTRDQGLVVKAAGLAEGKGVYVCKEPHLAVRPLEQIMQEKIFGAAGATVIIEEMLTGQEALILALCDGRTLYTLEACQDHKAVFDGDKGPNTGGMGAYSPAPIIDSEMMARVEREVLVPIVDAMHRSFGRYEGCLYAGIMLTPAGPKVLEFNARFGDPETQPLMMRMQGDLVEAMAAVCRHKLEDVTLTWDPRPAVCVVMTSGGYPGAYQQGHEITGIADADAMADVKVFHAGTALSGGKVVNAGGRVLGVTALGADIADAQKRAYEAVGKIQWKDCHYRRDIGSKAIR